MARFTTFSKILMGVLGGFVLLVGFISVVALRGCNDVKAKIEEQTELNTAYLGKTVNTESGTHTLVDYKVFSDVFVTDNNLEINAELARSMTDTIDIDSIPLETIQ